MIMTRKELVNDLILVIKKAAHQRAVNQICLDKLYNAGSDEVNLKSKTLETLRFGMTRVYARGYQDAADYDWCNLPLDMAFDLIDGYKSRALRCQNEYFAGLAQGAEFLVMNRQVAI